MSKKVDTGENLSIVYLEGNQCCQSKHTLFNKGSSSHSGIHFRNDIIENDSVNILDQSNIYNGGVAGVADFNNDGLLNIYFTGNMVSKKLYLNKGSLQFEDITATAAVDGEGKWKITMIYFTR